MDLISARDLLGAPCFRRPPAASCFECKQKAKGAAAAAAAGQDEAQLPSAWAPRRSQRRLIKFSMCARAVR